MHNASGLHRLQCLLSVGQRRCQRLFAEDVLSRPGRLNNDRRLRPWRHSNRNNIDVCSSDQRPPVRERPYPTELLGRRRRTAGVPPRNSRDAAPGVGAEGRCMHETAEAEPDEPDSNWLVHGILGAETAAGSRFQMSTTGLPLAPTLSY